MRYFATRFLSFSQLRKLDSPFLLGMSVRRDLPCDGGWLVYSWGLIYFSLRGLSHATQSAFLKGAWISIEEDLERESFSSAADLWGGESGIPMDDGQ